MKSQHRARSQPRPAAAPLTAAIVGFSSVCRALMVLSAGAAAEHLNLDAFIKQGLDYEETGTGLERLSRLFQDLQVTHPLPVKRVRELLDWVREGDYDRIVGGEYMKRGEEPPLRDESDAATAHYGERVRGAFDKAGSSIGEVGEQLSDWLEKRRRSEGGGGSNG